MAGFVIKDIWAFVAVDPKDGDEGICSFQMFDGDVHWPLVAADQTRVEQWRPIAQGIAKQAGVEVKLVRFTTRVEVESYEGSRQPG